MAMRGRGGRVNPNRPPRLGHTFKPFKPMSEWRQEHDHDTLLVYLPGFQKENIKVTTEDLNNVRVRGERLVSSNKWSEFREDFRVPENCEMSGIRARFDGGILTITMPRKIINPPPPTVTTTTTQVEPKTEEQPFKRTKQEETLQKPKEEPKEKKPSTTLDDKNNLSPKPIAMPNTNSSSTKQEQMKTNKETDESSKEFRFGSLPTSVPKNTDKHDVVKKPIISEKTDLKGGEKGKQTFLGNETRNTEGKMVKSNDGRRVQGGKTENKVAGRGVLGVLNEDRKVCVNVGVGVLVIVALGVHVSYTIGLIGNKGK